MNKLALVIVFGLIACAKSSPAGPAASDGGVDASVASDAGHDAVVAIDAAEPDAGGSLDAGSACADEIATLARLLDIGGRACSVTVRLDYQSRAVLGYQVFCGAYASTTEKQARARALEDVGGGDGTALNADNPDDAYVFYDPPGDFGGAVIVAARTNLTVFGGTIVWDGSGDINYPDNWRDSAELGNGCGAAGGLGTAIEYDLASGHAGIEEDIEPVLDVVSRTAVPAAIWQGGYVFHTTVVLYPRTVGAFNPANAEWIVVVHGGWLE